MHTNTCIQLKGKIEVPITQAMEGIERWFFCSESGSYYMYVCMYVCMYAVPVTQAFEGIERWFFFSESGSYYICMYVCVYVCMYVCLVVIICEICIYV